LNRKAPLKDWIFEEASPDDIRALDAVTPRPALLAALERERSRNHNFDFYDSPEGRRLRGFRKIALGFCRDLSRTAPDRVITYRPVKGGVVIRLDLPELRAIRQAFLSAEEFAAFRRHEILGQRLEPEPAPDADGN